MYPLQACEAVVRRRESLSDGAQPGRYDDLTALFADWRELQRPRLVEGVPDYTAAAMREQHRALDGYRKRLAAYAGSRSRQLRSRHSSEIGVLRGTISLGQ
jgi:hypothetical protein